MKTGLLIVAILLGMFTMAAAEPFSASDGVSIASAGPRINISEPIYHFGMVGANRQLKHTFEFRNDGVEDLIIYKVSPP